jgi:serine phosphatase RsbU (regulator of sigma subunit)
MKKEEKLTKETAEKDASDQRIPEELALTGVRKRRVSPLNPTVWFLILAASGGSAAAWLSYRIFGFEHFISAWILALIAGASWVVIIRMLLLDSRLKKFWIVWLAFGFFLTILFSSTESMWIASVVFSFAFLLFRRYKPYRHLTSRRRAGLFFIGFILFCLLTIGWLPIGTETIEAPEAVDTAFEPDIPALPEDPSELFVTNNLTVLGKNVAQYAIGSLRLFWLFSLLHIFSGVRLHFMKLRPKLAVSTFLIAIFPLVLILLMGLLTFYSILGASRATRAKYLLEDWTALAAQNENLIGQLTDQSFSYQKYGESIQTNGEVPSWLQEFIAALNSETSTAQEPIPIRRAFYLWEGSEIWLVTVRGREESSLRLRFGKVDSKMLDKLAGIVHSDISLSFESSLNISVGNQTVQMVESDLPAFKGGIQGRLHPQQAGQELEKPSFSLWKYSMYFGMAHLNVKTISSGRLADTRILMLLKTNLSSIFNELTSEKNPLSQAVMILLATLAVLLLILEAFAFYFGMRITTGITSAIKILHRGTKRIASGDFDTPIEISNEDELGDLAASFNAMAAAVKKGREEAVERERLERELKTAREIQERLLPHEMPLIPGFEISGTSLPSQHVGGDYFDFLDMDSGHLGIAIGDVSGKGIPAALLMANLQASLHGQAVDPEEVASVVSKINELLVRSTDSHMFATFFYGILNRRKATFTSSNAGHNLPLLVRTSGEIEQLSTGGLLLGFQSDQSYDQQVTQIKPGDVLVLYTDGITEAECEPSDELVNDKFFGEERLKKVIEKNTMKSAREIQAAILAAVADHMKEAPQTDDITLVVIKRKLGEEKTPKKQ